MIYATIFSYDCSYSGCGIWNELLMLALFCYKSRPVFETLLSSNIPGLELLPLPFSYMIDWF